MSDSKEILAEDKQRAANANPLWREPQFRRFLGSTAMLVTAFSVPLFELLRFAIGSQLYSHIPLIAGVSAYLVWSERARLPGGSPPAAGAALGFMLGGIAAGACWWLVPAGPAPEDRLVFSTLSFLLLVAALCSVFLGRARLRAIAFPLAFLVFMIPFPVVMTDHIETFLQHGSADVAYGLFTIAGTTVYHTDLIFKLPGITLEVAPECSGIHSSLVLLITSVLAGYFFLRTTWKRVLLALVVIPLALLRNGFRVFVLGELCVRVSPDMIDSPIHHHGGPIFFAASLVPLGFLLYYLAKSDRPVGTLQPRPE
ncbi:MAG TPA: exosortase [Candidatus Didemnitutus sp.]|nr:exosortase [Candidatus Didemnitutus sp.]